jgi:hypothetical protein
MEASILVVVSSISLRQLSAEDANPFTNSVFGVIRLTSDAKPLVTILARRLS